MSSINRIILKPIEAPISHVVIYKDRTEIKRVVKAKLTPGRHEVCIQGIGSDAISDSVRVNGRGNAVYQNVRIEDMYETSENDVESEAEQELKLQKNELNRLNSHSRRIKKRILNLERLVEQSMQSKDGDPNFLRTDFQSRFKDLDSFYDSEMTKLHNEEREIEEKIFEKETEMKKQKMRLKVDGKKQNGGFCKSIIATLSCEKEGLVELDISYQVKNASWKASYDVRVATGDKNVMKIEYFGNILQSSGEDWCDVELVLSTAASGCIGSLPELGTLEVSLDRRQRRYWNARRRMERSRSRSRDRSNLCRKEKMESESQFSQDLEEQLPIEFNEASVTDLTISSEFKIPGRSAILSNDERQRVLIGTMELPVQLLHECIPSMSPYVFLTASAVNNSKFTLLPGDVTVFVNDAFTTKTTFGHIAAGRFSCSLGRDQAVSVEYRAAAKKTGGSVSLLNSMQSISTNRTIILSNAKSKPVLLKMQENIPRSGDESIKVNVLSPTIEDRVKPTESIDSEVGLPSPGARLNNQHNLEWVIELNPGERKELQLKYVIKYPEDIRITMSNKY